MCTYDKVIQFISATFSTELSGELMLEPKHVAAKALQQEYCIRFENPLSQT